jgi:mono/diheme cytochrome c family protein
MVSKKQTSLTLLLGSALLLSWCQLQATGQNERKPNQAEPFVLKPTDFKPQPVSDESRTGQHLYERANCSACHSINNEGGKIGPTLDGIAKHHDSAFLFARLSNKPDDINEYAKLTGQTSEKLMPHIRVSPKEAQSLMSYLATLPEPKGGFVVYPHPSSGVEKSEVSQKFVPSAISDSSVQGRRLYEQFGCAQCHQIQRSGGYAGTTLDGVGRFGRDYVSAHITDAQIEALKTDQFFKLVPTSMPKFTATPEQVRKITDYLMTLPE